MEDNPERSTGTKQITDQCNFIPLAFDFLPFQVIVFDYLSAILMPNTALVMVHAITFRIHCGAARSLRSLGYYQPSTAMVSKRITQHCIPCKHLPLSAINDANTGWKIRRSFVIYGIRNCFSSNLRMTLHDSKKKNI